MNKPNWYTNDHDNSWERVKSAFRNDWEQTKHDFGSKNARDLDQDVDDTVKQAAGTEDTFERHEPAFKFGHAARIAQAGFRVIMPDLRAHGLSGKPHEATAYPKNILVRDLLELMGHTVTLAHDARGALSQAAEAVTPWDAFILDIGLPDTTGYELARRLRELDAARNSTFVALTGYGQAHDRVISKASGFHQHLVKPVDLAVLGEILASPCS